MAVEGALERVVDRLRGLRFNDPVVVVPLLEELASASGVLGMTAVVPFTEASGRPASERLHVSVSVDCERALDVASLVRARGLGVASESAVVGVVGPAGGPSLFVRRDGSSLGLSLLVQRWSPELFAGVVAQRLLEFDGLCRDGRAGEVWAWGEDQIGSPAWSRAVSDSGARSLATALEALAAARVLRGGGPVGSSLARGELSHAVVCGRWGQWLASPFGSVPVVDEPARTLARLLLDEFPARGFEVALTGLAQSAKEWASRALERLEDRKSVV